MYLAVESSGMALLRDSIVPVSTISCKKDPGLMRLVKPRRIMPALPTGAQRVLPQQQSGLRAFFIASLFREREDV